MLLRLHNKQGGVCPTLQERRWGSRGSPKEITQLATGWTWSSQLLWVLLPSPALTVSACRGDDSFELSPQKLLPSLANPSWTWQTLYSYPPCTGLCANTALPPLGIHRARNKYIARNARPEQDANGLAVVATRSEVMEKGQCILTEAFGKAFGRASGLKLRRWRECFHRDSVFLKRKVLRSLV